MIGSFKKILPFIIILKASCSQIEETGTPENTGFLKSKGFFVVNEGNFLSANGSLSFYSKDSSKIYNEVFLKINDRPLGDVPNSMVISRGKAYIIVNNSGKIEITDCTTMKSIATVKGLISPRYILIINKTKAYISSLYSTRLAIMDLQHNIITGYVELRRTSEAMVLYGNKAYVSCWSGGDEIMVINTDDDRVVDSIKTGHEPESMAIDKYGRLWVLCSGSYTGKYYPELISINLSEKEIEKRLVFDSKLMYPSCLRINNRGDTLYYIERSIWHMPVSADKLPAIPFVKASGRLFYKIGIDPSDGKLYATNAVDYQQKGYLMIFRNNGTATDSLKTGIIPGYICFREQD